MTHRRYLTAAAGVAIAAILLFGSCHAPIKSDRRGEPAVTYTVDITNPVDDLFHVTVTTANLGPGNNIYNFAATAPGTYSNLDFGRFVQSFSAFDAAGNEIAVEKISTNKWKIADPVRTAVLRYIVEDTFDSERSRSNVAPMCGSGIDSTYAAFNTFAVLGYFEGLQSIPVRMKVEYQPEWVIGVSLDKDEDGYYTAESFDRLADSPVLAGEVTFAETKVNDIDVEVYVFSPDTSLSAGKVLRLADDVLQSAGKFIGYSPVPYYKFLMVLLDQPTFQRYGLTSAGALEHSYNSLYVLPMTEQGLPQLRSTMAHEFMHILTPLFLHSEIIHSFNFAEPTPSQHIWLYEGVTEWISDIMQLRSGLMTTDQFLQEMSQKLRVNDSFNKQMSLTDMAQKVYTPEGGSQFGNVYQRGAVTAAFLDIRLLELSKGTRGLRELFLDLLHQYGKEKPFSEKNFFKVITDQTYPEIGEFVEKYIRGSEQLPSEKYMAKLGFRYIPARPSTDQRPTIGVPFRVDENINIVVLGMPDDAKESGFQEGDIVLKMFGTELTLANARDVINKSLDMKIGDTYEALVRRGGEEMTITGKLLRRMDRHVFEQLDTLTAEEKFLRERWMNNL